MMGFILASFAAFPAFVSLAIAHHMYVGCVNRFLFLIGSDIDNTINNRRVDNLFVGCTMAHLHSFDDAIIHGGASSFDTDISYATHHSAGGGGQHGGMATLHDNSVIFDYDGDTHVPLSLNGMLSPDESLPLGPLDDMDASSAAAAAASLDAFLADQSPSMTSSSMIVPSSLVVASGHMVHHTQVVTGGMQLAAGYPGYNGAVATRGNRTVGAHMVSQQSNGVTSQSLFHYPMQSSHGVGGVAGVAHLSYPQSLPHQHQQPLMGRHTIASYPGANGMPYIMDGEAASPAPLPSSSPYGYPMAYPGTTGGVSMTTLSSPSLISSSHASSSSDVISSSASVSSTSSVTSPIALSPPLTSVPSPLNTNDITGVPSSPVSPSSGSASDDNDSVAATKENRKRKNRGGGNGDDDDNSKKPVTEEEMQESKRQQRLMRNRASAQLSRERKKVYMKKLEGQLKELQQQNLSLSQQLTALKNENASLRQRSESLPTTSGYVYGHGAYPGSPDSHSSDGSTSPEHGYIPAPSYSSHGGNHAKRTRMAHNNGHVHHPSAAHHQMYPSLPPRVRAAGVVMFALMMSFTIFYNMAGIDFTNVVKNEITDGNVAVHGPSRVLQTSDAPYVPASIMSDTGMAAEPKSPRLKAFAGVSTMPTLETPAPYASIITTPSSSSSSDEFGLVVKQEGTSPAITHMPMVVVKREIGTDLEMYDDMTTSDDDDTSSVSSASSSTSSQSLARVAPGEFELFQQWKKMIVDANLTLDMNSSYMFCPSAIQMRPQSPVKTTKTHVHANDDGKDSAITARLRRAGLPLPNTTDADEVIAAAAARLSPSNNRLRLWVPTPSVIAAGDWDTTQFGALTEIDCQVSGIRPVIITNTATPTA